MEVFHSADEYVAANDGQCVATIGTYDGFHRGHAAIFQRLAAVGKSMNLPAVVITFHPHPRVIVTPDDPPLLLTTPEEKVDILSDRFDGSLVFLEFNDNLRRMSAKEFVHRILLDKFKIRALVVGYNHSLGHRRSGNIDSLAEIAGTEGFDLSVVGPVAYKEMPVSSTRIRRVISIGEWRDANEMLQHPYSIRGKVVRGEGRGKSIGWPTINLEWGERKLLPSEGVYSCYVKLNGSQYKGMMFIGVNMFNPRKTITVEANLFDFDRDIYDLDAILYPIHFIRNNRRFQSSDELSRQIEQDKKTVLELLN